MLVDLIPAGSGYLKQSTPKEPSVPGTWKKRNSESKNRTFRVLGKLRSKNRRFRVWEKNATIQNIARSWRVFEKKTKNQNSSVPGI